MLEKLALGQFVSPADKLFLEQHYLIDRSAAWYLDFVGDNYQLSNTALKLQLMLDFRSGNYRHRNEHIGKEPLLQAVKIKKKLPSSVLDTTPGVLKDSFMLAGRGVQVTAIERNPILYIMVKHALEQVEVPINYHFGDAKLLLSEHQADIIYLDPMYPPKKKAAQVKKDMQILHQIIGGDDDAAELLDCACQHAKSHQSRVVVKRPNYAEPLGNKKPSHTSQTGTTRFDVYL